MLTRMEKEYYRLQKGDTLQSVAQAHRIPECALIAENGLTREPLRGFLLKMPSGYSLYTVRGGDSKKSLCGSEERYRRLNGTDVFFIGMQIFIGEDGEEVLEKGTRLK